MTEPLAGPHQHSHPEDREEAENMVSRPVDKNDAAQLLRDVEAFVHRFVAYPSDAARVAHVLWVAHTWLLDRWDSTPRIAFLSPEPGSGKTRALEVTEPLVPRPIHAVNTTPAYLFRKVSDRDGRPTLLYDEIDTVFGPRAKDNEDVRGMLNAGHRRGATAGRCVVKGNNVCTEELPAYCAVALAGLNDLPDTLMTRSVVIRMQRRRPDEKVEPWRDRTCRQEGEALGRRLYAWAKAVPRTFPWPDMPDGIEDRDADKWEAPLAVADLAGAEWPNRARCSAVALVTQSREREGSLGIALLRDVREVFARTHVTRMHTDDLLRMLRADETAPWATLRGTGLDARGLARILGHYGIEPHNVRLGSLVRKGYALDDLADVFARYLPPLSESENSATSATPLHL